MKTFTDLYLFAGGRTSSKCVDAICKAMADDPYGDPIEAFENGWHWLGRSEDVVLSWFKTYSDFADDVLKNRFNGHINDLWEFLHIACSLWELRQVSDEEYEAAVQYHVFNRLSAQFPNARVDDETEQKLKQCIADCIADHYSFAETIEETTESYMQSVIH